MATTRFTGESLDDIMREVIAAIRQDGEPITPSEGPCLEIRGVSIELVNPRARLSRTEARGKPFSCLGELCWYLSGNNSLDFMRYYIKNYLSTTPGEVDSAGYGPRLLNWNGINQLERTADILSKKKDSRQAIIQLFSADDLTSPSGTSSQTKKGVPCTCTLQFMLRKGKLLLFTHMRSNDVYLGLPHDFFAFTMIQEIMARQVGADLGPYVHFVGSLHLYDRDRLAIDQFLKEGWQSNLSPMPDMPSGDPRPSIRLLLKVEHALRKAEAADVESPLLAPYWQDLARLLSIFRAHKENTPQSRAEMEAIRLRMSTKTYDTYITKIATARQPQTDQPLASVG